ncbi:MAG TPA: GDSL-type esterase/lipase family protein [Pseudonocardia sp.]|nr:GDSL-type esterase/lipase family protein [Pseudonocardia sp.]
MLVALLLGTGTAAGPWVPAADASAAAAVDDCAPAWTTAWQASPQPGAGERLAGRTLRLPVAPRLSGTHVRVRLSNRHGDAPLVVGTASAAGSAGGAGLLPATVRALTFGGLPGAAVAPGAEVVSDPVPLAVAAGRPLAVSLYLPAAPATVAEHPVALQPSWLSRPGDVALDPGPAAFDTTLTSWPVLTAVDVLAPRPVAALLAVGDSITDGVGAHAGARWPDVLAARLRAAGGPAVMSVLNAGVSGDRLLPGGAGDAVLQRLDADLARAAGLTDVVLHAGTNDIATGREATEIVDGLAAFAGRARRAGLRVFLTTVTPAVAGPHGTGRAAAVRDAVNAWVREHGPTHADGVFDFAAAVADPAAPYRLAPASDSGDGLHLSAEGYRALAGAVVVERLSGSPCLAGPRAAEAEGRAGGQSATV